MDTAHKHEKTLRKGDIFLYCVSAVLLLETLTAGAVMGPTVIFWWLFLTIVFLLPFGAISTELGVHYPEQGGIYAWVKRAFGRKMASRISWYYWANVAAWLPAIVILFSGIASQLFFPDMSLKAQIILGLALIWVVTVTNILTLSIGKWVPNLGAIIKLLLFALLIIGGINYGLANGVANEFSLATIFPTIENGGWSLQYLPALVYGMLGFELASASSEEMKNPSRDLPKAVFTSIFVVVAASVLATVAILIAIPAGDVDVVDGLIETLTLFFGGGELGVLVVSILGLGALYTFFSNGTTWAMGANRAAAQAAIDKELPAILGKETNHGTPIGAAICLGVASSAMLILYGLIAKTNADLFWTLFAFSGVIFMLPYVVMCLAFVKIRTTSPPSSEGFRFPGGSRLVTFLSYMCALILAITIMLFMWTPGEAIYWEVIWGSLVVIALGEIIILTGEMTQK